MRLSRASRTSCVWRTHPSLSADMRLARYEMAPTTSRATIAEPNPSCGFQFDRSNFMSLGFFDGAVSVFQSGKFSMHRGKAPNKTKVAHFCGQLEGKLVR